MIPRFDSSVCPVAQDRLAVDESGPATITAPGHDRTDSKVSRPNVDRLLTADELAQRLGMKTEWVWPQARAGTIPHVRLGRYRRFRQVTRRGMAARARDRRDPAGV